MVPASTCLSFAVMLAFGALRVLAAAPATAEPSPTVDIGLADVFGGVTLITDQPVRVGDFCRFGTTEIEIFADVLTPRWTEYVEHREQILLGALEAMDSDATTLK